MKPMDTNATETAKAANAALAQGSPRKPVTLSDGRTAVLTRKAKGKDLVFARRVIGKDGSDEELAFALLSRVLTIDGQAVTYEESLELDLVDLMVLSDGAGSDFPEEASKS